eukprot:2191056-Pyramimonas_sp.AAC.1
MEPPSKAVGTGWDGLLKMGKKSAPTVVSVFARQLDSAVLRRSDGRWLPSPADSKPVKEARRCLKDLKLTGGYDEIHKKRFFRSVLDTSVHRPFYKPPSTSEEHMRVKQKLPPPPLVIGADKKPVVAADGLHEIVHL